MATPTTSCSEQQRYTFDVYMVDMDYAMGTPFRPNANASTTTADGGAAASSSTSLLATTPKCTVILNALRALSACVLMPSHPTLSSDLAAAGCGDWRLSLYGWWDAPAELFGADRRLQLQQGDGKLPASKQVPPFQQMASQYFSMNAAFPNCESAMDLPTAVPLTLLREVEVLLMHELSQRAMNTTTATQKEADKPKVLSLAFRSTIFACRKNLITEVQEDALRGHLTTWMQTHGDSFVNFSGASSSEIDLCIRVIVCGQRNTGGEQQEEEFVPNSMMQILPDADSQVVEVHRCGGGDGGVSHSITIRVTWKTVYCDRASSLATCAVAFDNVWAQQQATIRNAVLSTTELDAALEAVSRGAAVGSSVADDQHAAVEAQEALSRSNQLLFQQRLPFVKSLSSESSSVRGGRNTTPPPGQR